MAHFELISDKLKTSCDLITADFMQSFVEFSTDKDCDDLSISCFIKGTPKKNINFTSTTTLSSSGHNKYSSFTETTTTPDGFLPIDKDVMFSGKRTDYSKISIRRVNPTGNMNTGSNDDWWTRRQKIDDVSSSNQNKSVCDQMYDIIKKVIVKDRKILQKINCINYCYQEQTCTIQKDGFTTSLPPVFTNENTSPVSSNDDINNKDGECGDDFGICSKGNNTIYNKVLRFVIFSMGEIEIIVTHKDTKEYLYMASTPSSCMFNPETVYVTNKIKSFFGCTLFCDIHFSYVDGNSIRNPEDFHNSLWIMNKAEVQKSFLLIKLIIFSNGRHVLIFYKYGNSYYSYKYNKSYSSIRDLVQDQYIKKDVVCVVDTVEPNFPYIENYHIDIKDEIGIVRKSLEKSMTSDYSSFMHSGSGCLGYAENSTCLSPKNYLDCEDDDLASNETTDTSTTYLYVKYSYRHVSMN